MAIMGIVRLAPGRVGYFDEITRIHLTLSSPERAITEGMNATNIKRAVKLGTLKLVSGSLDPETKPLIPEVKLNGEEKMETLKEVDQNGMQDQEGQQEKIREVIDNGEEESKQEVESAKAIGNDDPKTDGAENESNAKTEEEVPATANDKSDVHDESKQVRKYNKKKK